MKSNASKRIITALLTIVLLCSTLISVSAARADGTHFEIVLSGNENAIIGETYELILTAGDFSTSAFYGYTATVKYDTSFFELNADFLQANLTSDTNGLVSAPSGWVFWAAERTPGEYTVNVLNDNDELASLTCDTIVAKILFTVKSTAGLDTAEFKIDTDNKLVGSCDLETEKLVSVKGTGSTLTVNVIAEAPKPQKLELKDGAAQVIADAKLYGAAENLDADAVKALFKNDAADIKVTLSDKNVLGTGCKIELMDGETAIDSVTAVVSGDVDGSGIVDSTDYILLRRVLVNTYAVTGITAEASDIDEKGSIDSTDLILLKRHLVNTFNIFA